MLASRYLLLALGLCYFFVNDAQALSLPKSSANYGISLNRFAEQGDILELRVKEVSLNRVLTEIAAITQITMHFSTLPDELVSAHCKGLAVEIMQCLLGERIDLAVRYEPSKKNMLITNQAAEMWFLNFQTGPLKKSIVTQEDYERSEAASVKKEKNAVTSLTSTTNQTGTVSLEELSLLQVALDDVNPLTRVQAVQSLGKLGSESVQTELQQAMLDVNPDVRLSVVETIDINSHLLQQALNDSDETVRQMAATRLGILTSQEEKIK